MNASLSELLDQLVLEPSGLCASTPVADVSSILLRARQAQRIQSQKTTLKQRAACLVRLADLMAEHQDALARLISHETGKPREEAILHELFGTIQLARFAAREGPKVLGSKTLTPWLFWHRKSTLYHVPHGVVAIVSPWNFPFALPMGDVLLALLAGNAVVLKPSEHTPRTAVAIRALVTHAGFDPAVMALVLGDGAQGQAVVDGAVDMVRFTGSVATGKRIAQSAASRLIPTVLELGGKDAAVVLEDADIDKTADLLVYGAFANAGQVCASIERAYIPEPLFQSLVAAVVKKTLALRVATTKGGQEHFDVGPMMTRAQRDVVTHQLDEVIRRKGRVLCGAEVQGDAIMPTVVVDVDESFAVCREETFGPILPLMAVPTSAHGIARANASRYGLTAYVFGQSKKACAKAALALEAGTVMVNDVLSTHAAPEAPWGGIKDSGLGHTHSALGIQSYCQLRHVNRPRGSHRQLLSPFGFPYSALTARAVEMLLTAQQTNRPLWQRLTGLLKSGVALQKLMRQRRRL